MKYFIIACLAFITAGKVYGQHKTENLVIVTLDGMRWQEVFKGADSVLINDSVFTRDKEDMANRFWAPGEQERRKKLFPFIWNVVQRNGQLYGNRMYGNKVDNANPYWFSYPGYNEIFTGYPDTAVNSNDKINNKNVNVLEYLNHIPAFHDKIAVFATWDVFPFIFNKERSGLYVNADNDPLPAYTPELKLLNTMQQLAPRPIGVRQDILTYFGAREYMKAKQPRVLYIAFDETDDFAHSGMYDQYLGSAHAQDAMIADLWNLIQSMPAYKDKTTLLITCDHGRGDMVKSEWQHHGQRIRDAHEIWFALMGPDTAPAGEIKKNNQYFQAQLAATIAKLLGQQFKADHPVMDPVQLEPAR